MRLPAGYGVAAAVLALLAGACSHHPTASVQDEYISIGNGRLIDDFDDAQVIGNGPYRYRFVLHRSPHGGPATSHPFALSNRLHQLPFVTDAKQVFRGVTDAQGRTPVFAFPHPIETDSWLLRECFGDGPFGEQFRFSHADGTRRFGVPYIPYRIVVCGPVARMYRGISDGNGHTGYVASAKPNQAFLFELADEEAEARHSEQNDNLQAARYCKERRSGS